MSLILRNKKLEKERNKANLEILGILKKVVNRHPYLRFGQLLLNIGVIMEKHSGEETQIVDPFYEEPADTLERIKNNIMYKHLNQEEHV